MTTRTELAAELAKTHDMDDDAARRAVDVYAGQLEVAGDEIDDENADHIRAALAAERAVVPLAALDAVMDATERKRVAQADAEEADREWRAAIRAAIAAGERVALIAEAAGIGRDRVYQIRDGRR